MYHKHNVPTQCKQGADRALCEIGDIAPNIAINDFVNDFIKAKLLGKRGNTRGEEVILEALGLYDDVELLIEFENIWSKYLEIETKKQRMLNSG